MLSKEQLEALDSLPVQLGIRLLLDSVSYSSAVPDWVRAFEISYRDRERAIRQRIHAWLAKPTPIQPFEIEVPRKSGDLKLWSIPTVNDQIIVQVCVSSISEHLYRKTIEREKVFSYRLATHQSGLALTEDHLASWRAFQKETKRRCASGDCVLQIDIQDAFASIDRERVVQFLRDLLPDRIEVNLLQVLLDSFAAGRPGLPLVNDSIFFLGNTYLSVVDAAISRHSTNFIRFVDDYRIFGASKNQLDNILAAIKAELSDLGFQIHKVRNETGNDYLDALSSIRYAERESDGAVEGDSDPDDAEMVAGYLAPAIFVRGLLPANAMLAQIKTTLQDPNANLNEGRGRLLMGLLRRSRLDESAVYSQSDGANGFATVRNHFIGQLSKDKPLIDSIIHFLKKYAEDPHQTWRLIWLLYLAEDIHFGSLSKSSASQLKQTLMRIRDSHSVAMAARLWAANRLSSPIQWTKRRIEAIHDLGYVAGGRTLWRV